MDTKIDVLSVETSFEYITMSKLMHRHLHIIAIILIIQYSGISIFAINLRQAPPEPPPIPSDSSGAAGGTTDHVVPEYPLPPLPALSPPSTMPFAIFDQERSNGFTPPTETVIDSNKIEDQNKEQHTKKGAGLAFEAPPMLEMSGPSGPGFSNQHVLSSVDNFLLRKDSANPYCEFCKATIVQLDPSVKLDEKITCHFFPFSAHKTCHAVVKALHTIAEVKSIQKNGCVDRTSGMATIKQKCPPLVGCNIIKTKAGMPMCGTVVNGWGNLITDSATNNNPPFAPPPGLNAITGSTNKYCDMCRSIISVMHVHPTISPEKVCEFAVPSSQQEPCLKVQEPLRRSVVFKQIMKDGCIDTTDSSGALEQKKCSPYIACNLIGDVSGNAMCGTHRGIYGKLK